MDTLFSLFPVTDLVLALITTLFCLTTLGYNPPFSFCVKNNFLFPNNDKFDFSAMFPSVPKRSTLCVC